MLKFTYDSMDAVPAELANFYTEVNGVAQLQIDGYEDPAELRRARDREKEAARTLRESLTSVKTELNDTLAQLDEARRQGGNKINVDQLENSYKQRLNSAGARADKLKDYIKRNMIDSTADVMAADVSLAPSIMRRIIAERLAVEFDENDMPSLRVLDGEGQISSLSTSDLRREIIDNKEYASIIKIGKATGSGASGHNGRGGGGAAPKPHEMTTEQRAEFLKSDPAGFHAAKRAGAFNPPQS